jgi:preprotein translocase subunit SecF
MNQTLMRSLNTSLVAILPIMSVLVIGAFVLGATTLQDFGLALLIGLLTGAYSSIYIASPVLAILKEREPRYASIRQRILARGGTTGAPLTPAAAAAGGLTVSTKGDSEGLLRPGAAKAGGGGSGRTGGATTARSKSSTAKSTTAQGKTTPGTATGKVAGKVAQGNRPPPRPRKKGKRR